MTKLAAPFGNLLLAVLFAGIYMVVYERFLYVNFEYGGFLLHRKDPAFVALSLLLAVLPSLLYRGMRALSSFFSVFIFVVLYIPIILTLALASDRPLGQIVLLQLAFAAGMTLLFMADWVGVRNPLNLRTRWNLVSWAMGLTIVVTVYLLGVYGGNLRFVSFGEAVYEQRFANVELGAGLVTRYSSSWLANVLIPICLAYGVVTRRYRYFVVGSAACLVIYMATAAKIIILFPFLYAGFYALFAGGRLRRLYPIFVVSLSAAMLVLLAVSSLGGILFLAASILMMRTVANGGLLAMQYYDFFAFHPHTNYTHVNIIRRLTDAYPYGDLGVGNVVGTYFYSPDMNANASFWVTDGIAAAGLPGVLLASVGCAVVFLVMNSFTRAYDRLFVGLCFLPFIVSLLNASLFSSLWSGGAIFLLLFFALHRAERSGIYEARILSPVSDA